MHHGIIGGMYTLIATLAMVLVLMTIIFQLVTRAQPVPMSPKWYRPLRRYGMIGANPTTALQVGNPTMGTVSRQPQTTAAPAAAASPFVRQSRKAFNRGYSVAGNAFGALVNQPIKPVGGWLRHLVLTIAVVNGTSSGAVVVNGLDTPWNIIQTLLLRDPLGQPILNLDGYGAFLTQLYSGQAAMGRRADPSVVPSFSPVQLTSGAGAGNFQFKLILPFELDSAGYCALSSLNAAANIQMDLQMATSAAIYSTPPTTLGTITVTVEQAFWAAPPNNPQLGPPDPGASSQWTKVGGQTAVASATNTLIASPRKGTFIHSLIAVLRDANGVRQDNWPLTDLTLQIDGVPLKIEMFNDRVDDMDRFTDGITRPTGVIAHTWRDAVQQEISSADTHDLTLPTTPASLIELGGTFQVITTAPGVVTFYVGELFPTNNAKVPYTHLAA